MISLIVPMGGYGSRFKKAGYKTYKPFIKINGRCMIDYVVEPFPKDIKKIFIINPEMLSKENLEHLKNIGNSKIINIESHKNGPSYTIDLAKDKLDLDDSYFISYSDHYWTWDYEEVKKILDYSGVVFTKRKWHPHLYKDSNSAFCLPKENNKNLMLKIKEKHHFTEDWMTEPHSMGTYYFKSGRDMIRLIEKQIKNNTRVNNEFFPSELFNELVNEGNEVYLYDVDFYMHFGIPSQLEDFNHWRNVFSFQPKKNSIKNICIMGGIGKRMKSISNTPKTFIEISGYPMFEHCIKNFGSKDNVVVTTDEIAEQLPNRKINYELINIGEQTKSQIDTIKKAIPYIKEQRNFLMTSCDAYGVFDSIDFENFLRETNPDAVLFTFTPTLMQVKMQGHHSHVSVKDNKITKVHIKSKSSKEDKGLAGMFWFNSGDLFEEVKNIQKDPDTEMIADHLLKHLVKIGKKVLSYPVKEYVHLGTIPEYKEYKFWEEYEKKGVFEVK